MAEIDNSLGQNNGTGGGIWGTITGNVIDQTDLINYLDSNFYPLLTNPANYITLADIPPSITPNLQQVTDVNNVTSKTLISKSSSGTNGVLVSNDDESVSTTISNEVISVSDSGLGVSFLWSNRLLLNDFFTGDNIDIDANLGFLKIKSAYIKTDNIVDIENFQLPDKGGLGGTFAMLDDIIPYSIPTLQEVADQDNHLVDREILFGNTADPEFKTDLSSYFLKNYNTSTLEETLITPSNITMTDNALNKSVNITHESILFTKVSASLKLEYSTHLSGINVQTFQNKSGIFAYMDDIPPAQNLQTTTTIGNTTTDTIRLINSDPDYFTEINSSGLFHKSADNEFWFDYGFGAIYLNNFTTQKNLTIFSEGINYFGGFSNIEFYLNDTFTILNNTTSEITSITSQNINLTNGTRSASIFPTYIFFQEGGVGSLRLESAPITGDYTATLQNKDHTIAGLDDIPTLLSELTNDVGYITSTGITPSALTKTNDTNVTLTLGGSPSTALLQGVSLTLGWTGTLASSRLNSNVVQSVTNDTNITGSISAQNLTLGWTGTLADSRIASATNWNTAYTNRITSLTTTGSSGASTLISNVLNIPNYTLSGLGGQPQLSGTGFVKASGTTISYDNSTYLTTSSAASTYAALSGSIFTGSISATNLSGTNTGDETQATILAKLGWYNNKITTPSGPVASTTSETQVLQVTIPPNTFASGDILKIPSLIVTKTGVAGNCTIRVKMSTSSTMPALSTGQIATFQASSTILFINMKRDFYINGGNISGYPFTTSLIDSTASAAAAISSQAFNPAVTNYLYVSITNGSAGDSTVLTGIQITNV